uniref:GMP phosphodiesterase delta subunit domain-containing protein n=1 Tax=Polytomella parva TaxID=51329 RepID=A0A7S0UIK8_9CHLO|mmetsp:Transcript_10397/g.19151  ORF Transcript_10397/g.19151 Transcript_10397/m.19151 type:complete len:187 (+) Transcript_10397:84-644(+)|eukprot:CAMPEP_0175045738 /NCGR_PEP_ID=MMETSP0052_2-20121109/4611_1 /TAXON_ID=51329 ORGANISM="Polytomella parva, Strain SAG 63-3" /NCGR_SAMPLE_ID=MMETSP0052_2 /ASSEMBLY_ACC=CAM_ASM_000194 /LENGTH=186 /DNA_ID=CAMNT_0016309345 /DNA_START=42 /DNA_END=602 /DNA_ORIENTATION=-
MPPSNWESISPADVLSHSVPTSGYLCPLKANNYGIEFLKFEVRDYDTGKVIYQVSREPDPEPLPTDLDPEIENLIRSVKYTFPMDFLKCNTIRTALEFSVGNEPLGNFRMVERHYFEDKLVKSYDFSFGFCIPNSTNSWEAIYDVPENTPEMITKYVNNPFQHKSDSFYFVNDRLVMHNKAEYQYM